MGVIFGLSYALPAGDQPLTHARIAHAGNWVDGVVTSTQADVGYFVDAPNNSLTYERWKPVSVPATWEIETAAPQEVDYCCIAAHDMGSSGTVLSVQYHTGTAWADVASSAIKDNMPTMSIFGPVTATRFRVVLANGVPPEIGVIRFGKALQMPQPIYGGHQPGVLARETTLSSNFSETGEFLGRSVVRNFLKTSYSWAHLKASWVRSEFMPFVRAAESEPFFIAWRPETFDDVIYCQSTGPIIPTNMGIKDYMQASVSVTGRGYD